MTSDERKKVRDLAKKHGGDLKLAALEFLGVEPVNGGVPVGNEAAVGGIVWEVENVKDEATTKKAAGK